MKSWTERFGFTGRETENMFYFTALCFLSPSTRECVCVLNARVRTQRAFCLAVCESGDVGVEETEGERGEIIGEGRGAGGRRGAGLMMRVWMAAIFSLHVRCVPKGVGTRLEDSPCSLPWKSN